jgi:hypothetical protein
MKRGQIRGVEAGQVGGVDEDRYSKGCCGPDTSWDKNFNIVLLFHEDVLFRLISFLIVLFRFVTRNRPFCVTQNSAK